jgi:hypothetical protein
VKIYLARDRRVVFACRLKAHNSPLEPLAHASSGSTSASHLALAPKFAPSGLAGSASLSPRKPKRELTTHKRMLAVLTRCGAEEILDHQRYEQ